MKDEIFIREALVDDAADLLEIERASTGAPHWEEGVWSRVFTSHELRGPQRRCFVAEHAAAVVGFIVVSALAGSSAGDGLAEMESLAVAEYARRHGVGRALCLHAMLWTQTMGAAMMQLEVRSASGGALALYRSLGFVEQGRRPRYYRDPEDDAVLMELLFCQRKS